MPVIRRIVVLVALCCAMWLVAAMPANAQSCTVSVTNISFGDVDPTLNAAVDVTGTVSVTCTGAILTTLVCVDLGPGSGGATNAANRRVANGANTLPYGLFTDAARSIPWVPEHGPVPARHLSKFRWETARKREPFTRAFTRASRRRCR